MTPVSELDEHSQAPGETLREHLRAIPSLVGTPPGFDPATRPDTPQELFLDWLRSAEAAGIPEPHAMTVSTVDSDGMPDSRLLVLKDLTAEGAWCFAGKRDSAKGRQLAVNPVAALTFYWRDQVRSVRIRGRIVEGTDDESRRDFLARNPEARAIAFSGTQSAPLESHEALTDDLEEARRRLARQPDAVPAAWTVWHLHPDTVEFWEGATSRIHTRLRYDRASRGWSAQLLRP
ncbi:pyridoxine/pyridoxamine 5'-phosphate oxidase [Rathayibacter sp. CAU 1779]